MCSIVSNSSPNNQPQLGRAEPPHMGRGLLRDGFATQRMRRALAALGRWCAWGLSGLGFWCGVATTAQAQAVHAYHAHWMGEAWRVHDLRQFQRIYFFDIVADAGGALSEKNGWPDRWQALRQQAREVGVAVDPVVTVLGKDRFTAIFGQAAARERLLIECAALALDSGGLHLDVEVFEPVGDLEREGFRAFLSDLDAVLGRTGRPHLSVFVPSAGELFTPKELSYFDTVVAQGYDAHWAEAPKAGPVALLEGTSAAAWRPAAEKLLFAGVPRRKLFFSTPLYGYEWPVVSDAPGAASRGKAVTVTYAPVPADLLPDIRVNALTRSAQWGLRRDPDSGAAWYAMRDEDGWRQGWFDDAASLRTRLDFVRDNAYGGVAFFVLGYDGGALLEVARGAFRAPVTARAEAGERPPSAP